LLSEETGALATDAYVRLDTTAPGGDVVGDIRVDALAPSSCRG
jgi:hypothetical protein